MTQESHKRKAFQLGWHAEDLFARVSPEQQVIDKALLQVV